jgi:arabinofuranan 3-O-arabinosyltransferase
VGGLRLTPSTSTLPAHPTLVAIDLGDGPQLRRLTGDTAQTVSLRPTLTDTVKVSLLDWDDVIDRTALGFDQIKPPGLAEITALDAQGRPIAAADAARNRQRAVTLPCGRGPIIAVAGQFVQTAIDTTVGALLDGDPVPAKPCRPDPIALPSGQQELLISPGAAFVVDGVQLVGPLGRQLPSAATNPVQTGTWSPDRREVDVPASQTSRILVVPESINPGWTARTADGAELSPVTVNGWQQGWVVPAGTSGGISLSFGSNAVYRAGITGGLALLPILALLALVPARRPPPAADPAKPWRPNAIVTGVAILAVGAVIAGIAGVAVVGAAIGVRYLLRNRPQLNDAVTVGTSAGGLILAGAVLSQNPWRSVNGYAGHSAGVQLLALISIAALAASVASAECRNSIPFEERSTPPTSE